MQTERNRRQLMTTDRRSVEPNRAQKHRNSPAGGRAVAGSNPVSPTHTKGSQTRVFWPSDAVSISCRLGSDRVQTLQQGGRASSSRAYEPHEATQRPANRLFLPRAGVAPRNEGVAGSSPAVGSGASLQTPCKQGRLLFGPFLRPVLPIGSSRGESADPRCGSGANLNRGSVTATRPVQCLPTTTESANRGSAAAFAPRRARMDGRFLPRTGGGRA